MQSFSSPFNTRGFLPHPPAAARILRRLPIANTAANSSFCQLLQIEGGYLGCWHETNAGADQLALDGEVVLARSEDFVTWTELHRFAGEEGVEDFFSPVVGRLPNGNLVLYIVVRHGLATADIKTRAWISSDEGVTWTHGEEINIGLNYPSSPKVYGDWSYLAVPSFFYGTGPILYRTQDGLNWELVSAYIAGGPPPGYGSPGETNICFVGNTLVSLSRRDPQLGYDPGTLLATANPPFTNWTITDLLYVSAGPVPFPLPDGRVLVAGRFYNPWMVCLHWLDLETGTLTPLIELTRIPSGTLNPDLGYPGMVVVEGVAKVLYYTNYYDGKSIVYAAQVALGSD